MASEDQLNILMVDDQPAKLLVYEAILKELGENLIRAESAREALSHLLRSDIAVILMDVSMPDMNGLELAALIRQHPRYRKTTIIFVSAVRLSEIDQLQGYEAGAVDYVSVPVVPEILRAKVRVFGELYRKTEQLERLNRELERRVTERTTELEQRAADLQQLYDDLERSNAEVQAELLRRIAAEQALEAERAQLAVRIAERTAELSIANAELARASRLKDEFLANMSHELRTPLNAILGRAEILTEELYGPLTPKQRDSLRSIDESGRHLLALINDILDLSKIEAGKLALVSGRIVVDELCRASLRLVSQQAFHKSVTLTSSIDPAVEALVGDERRLKQILVNLLSNAVKFTPSGGRVQLEVRGDAAAETVSFAITDTGIGIAPAYLGRLFKPFVQVDSGLQRQYGGTGLGLALVLQLAKAHGGSVAVDSEPGRGSSFTVTLPWIGEASSAAASAELQQDAAQGVPAGQVIRRLLLTDDHPENSAFLKASLERKQFDVHVVHSGAEALAYAASEPVDVVVLDVQVAGVDVLMALRALGAGPHPRCVPLIAVTALAMPGDHERCREAGADVYLTKPVSPRRLIETIEAQLHRTVPLPT